MRIALERSTLDRLAHRLAKPMGRDVSGRLKKMVNDRHATVSEVSDLLLECGAPIMSSAREFLGAFDIALSNVYWRPRGHCAWGFDGIHVADVAKLLIGLERLGLSVDPEPLVAMLRPELKARRMFSATELAVWWYARERHRLEPVHVVAADRPSGIATAHRESVTATGYLVDAFDDETGLVWLSITAPKYRKRSKRARQFERATAGGPFDIKAERAGTAR